MNGFAVIILGFIAFGVLHTTTHNFMPWQWCASSLLETSHTLTESAQVDDHYRNCNPNYIRLVLVLLPRFPRKCSQHVLQIKILNLIHPKTTARFLTPEERIIAVQRIKSNQAGVENKHWKKEQ